MFVQRSIASRILILTAALLAASLPRPGRAIAADGLDVERAIQEGSAASPQLLRAEAAAREADVRVSDAFSGYLPRVALGASHLLDKKYQVLDASLGGGRTVEFPMKVASTTLSLDASINLFDGLQTTHAFLAARKARDATRNDADRARFQTSEDIRLKFFQALAARRLADVADQNVKTLQDHLAKSKTLVRGGSGTRIDALRVEVQLSEAIPEQQQAHDNVLITRMNLAQAMGLEHDDRDLVGELPTPEAGRIPAELRLDAGNRADLQALAARADAASSVESAAMSLWVPRIGLAAQTQLYNNRDDSFDSAQFRNAYTIAVTASWTLFDWSSISKARATDSQTIQAEKASQAAALRAPVDFELWKRRFLSNSALYSARRRAIETAEESVRLAHIGYEAGARTSTEVLDTELDLFRARGGAVRAQLDAAEALINLELASGQLL